MNSSQDPTRTRPLRLIGASLGPGDPSLITRAAWEALTTGACWAWPVSGSGPSHALGIVQRAGLKPPPRSLALHFPMTREPAALAVAWSQAAAEVVDRLRGGTDLVFLVEGDASTHATFGHLSRAVRALAPEVQVDVLPGVPSFTAAAAASGKTLADGEESIAVCAATRALPDLDAWLARADTLVLLKVRPVLDALIEALAARGLLAAATFVDRVGTPDERILTDLTRLRGERVHYLSLVLVRCERGLGLGQAPQASIAAQPAPAARRLATRESTARRPVAHQPVAHQPVAHQPAATARQSAPQTLIVALTEPGARLAARLDRLLLEETWASQQTRTDEHMPTHEPARRGQRSPEDHVARPPSADQSPTRLLVPERLLQAVQAEMEGSSANVDSDRLRITPYTGPLAEPLGRFFADAMASDAPQRLVFIGAAGIIVRLIAPHLSDKHHDPAVLVVDEGGRFVIPLLSGHIGGANAFGATVARLLQAQLALTTASDVQGTIAVDLLGRELGWRIEAEPAALRQAARCVVDGRPVMLIEEACGREWWNGANAPPANIRCLPSLEAALAHGLEDACAVLWVTRRPLDAALASRLGERLVVYRPVTPAPATPGASVQPVRPVQLPTEPITPSAGIATASSTSTSTSASAVGGYSVGRRSGPEALDGDANPIDAEDPVEIDPVDPDDDLAGTPRVAIGVGCDRGATLETVAGCVDAALRTLDAPRVLVLASVMQKRDEPAIQALAAERGWPLCFYPAAELAAIPVANPSATVRRLIGTAGVAEAAALRAAGAELKGLLVEKQRYRGTDGRNATVAIARVSTQSRSLG
jgi:precorrin-2/cobalt-factor-2 C20-methyltransferase